MASWRWDCARNYDRAHATESSRAIHFISIAFMVTGYLSRSLSVFEFVQTWDFRVSDSDNVSLHSISFHFYRRPIQSIQILSRASPCWPNRESWLNYYVYTIVINVAPIKVRDSFLFVVWNRNGSYAKQFNNKQLVVQVQIVYSAWPLNHVRNLQCFDHLTALRVVMARWVGHCFVTYSS